jgi:hypothetical protein
MSTPFTATLVQYSLILGLAEADRRLVVLTEKDMYDQCLKEQSGGRVPATIEFALAEIPSDMRLRLDSARKIASKEVRPITT